MFLLKKEADFKVFDGKSTCQPFVYSFHKRTIIVIIRGKQQTYRSLYIVHTRSSHRLKLSYNHLHTLTGECKTILSDYFCNSMWSQSCLSSPHCIATTNLLKIWIPTYILISRYKSQTFLSILPLSIIYLNP